MSSDSTENEEELVREYKYLLLYIRPLIRKLVKARDAELCLVWLSKLNLCSHKERRERNDILSELCRQVRHNRLHPPFDKPPPPGPLSNIYVKFLPYFWKSNGIFAQSSDTSRSSSTSVVSSPTSWHLSTLKRPRTLIGRRDFNEEELQKIISDGKPVLQNQEDFSSLIPKPKEINEITQGQLRKLQEAYETKISELAESLKDVEHEKMLLRKHIESLATDSSTLNDLKEKNEALQEKIVDLEAASSLLDMKYKELEQNKNEAMAEIIKRFNNSENKLKETENRLKLMEKNYQKSLYREKVEYQKLAAELEDKYASELSSLKSLLEEKENESASLREEVLNQCSRFQEEISRVKGSLDNADINKEKMKVKALKEKTKRMNDVKQKMVSVFYTQLQQVIMKKDLQIATLEMRLSAKNAELGSEKVAADIQETFNQKVSALEREYRTLLQESEIQAAKRRQKDLQRIQLLEKHILACGGGLIE